ncbi:DEAD/DEAH box helicase [Roseinatronobacter alkalisoli]|uniref:DEAD/DEAH box helicase n=1 Tax=Roseinatronobacter alkalisoli TaxID=3028235 RepID=A0ABT5T7S2_9RHOB|nr:DEAD/DEAH box helicase [Roseinatronobacter sp. HJB301]MDD7971109.1 DEAD/DEAH box helicase [Roseinatronobacter sp. HJB301]
MISPLSEALAERGFDILTPVQQAVTASDVASADLLVSAQTGSGKTVGFGLAIAPTLLGDAQQFGPAALPLALVVAPTRELAFQVMRELTWLYARTGAVVTSCVGGMDIRAERRALDRGAHIVVGTPGRLRDHIERRSLDLGEVQAIVLDEADEMLDLGFREDLEFMLGQAPAERRTLMFSATVSPMIAKLAKQYQRDAMRINTLGGGDQHADISYQALRVSASDSEHAIFNLLRFHEDQSAIVFANTRAAVNHLSARLLNRGLATVSLSGELSQTERTHALQAMRDGRARVCVATDVAARGIDLPNLNLVIHADLPTNTESLLHRSGRTGRAGRKGISALIVPPKAVGKAERLLKWAKISAEWTVAPSVDDVLRKDEERLLSDQVWTDPVTEEQAAFAQKLLALHAPDVIAAAYLRLFQSRHAAPEELRSPDAKPAAREHREFGPSRWFALSVGREDRAEARWLLPLLCRAGNLEKSAIGAIRVQDKETFVELAESSAAGFLTGLGPDGVLEEGISARAVDGAPDLHSSGGRSREGAGKPRDDRERSFAPKPKPRDDRDRGGAPRPKPRETGLVGHERAATSQGDRPKPTYGDASTTGAAPEGERKPRHKSKSPKPEMAKPAYAPKGAGAARPDRADAPRSKAKPERHDPASKAAGKPWQKPGAKPKGRAAEAGADARDSSRRFTPPGMAKPGKPRKPAGSAPRPGGPRSNKR